MTRFILAAVSHHVSEGFGDQLMCRESAELFAEKCEPLITDASFLLGEGYDARGLIRPSDALYDRLYSDIFGLAGSAHPTLGCFDFRQREARTVAGYFGVAEREDRWQSAIGEIIDTNWRDFPDSFEETVRRVKSPPAISFKRSPTREEKNRAREVGAQARKFDRTYLDAMRKYGRQFDVCMFIGGSSHVVAMSLQRPEYEIMDCVPPREIRDVYFAYLSTYVWTRHVMNAK